MKLFRRLVSPAAVIAAFSLGLFACKRADHGAAPASRESVAALPPAFPSPLIGMAAPAWTLKDLDGKEVSFSQFKGKVVVVDFWATWCGPCVQEIPGYVELQKKYADRGLVIVGVSVDTKKVSDVKAFVQSKGMNYTVVMADEATPEAFGGIEAIPTTFLINREGKVVHAKMGAWDHAAYEQVIQKVL